MPDRPVKITFAQMRNSGVRGILVYCCDYRCTHSNDVGLSQIELRFVCTACGERGATCGQTSILERHQADRRNGLPLKAAIERPSFKPWNGHTKLGHYTDGRTAARPGSRGSVPLSHPRATYAPAATAPLLIEQRCGSLLRQRKERCR